MNWKIHFKMHDFNICKYYVQKTEDIIRFSRFGQKYANILAHNGMLDLTPENIQRLSRHFSDLLQSINTNANEEIEVDHRAIMSGIQMYRNLENMKNKCRVGILDLIDERDTMVTGQKVLWRQ